MPEAPSDASEPLADTAGGQGKVRTKRLDFAERAVLMRYLQTHPDMSSNAIAVTLGHSASTVAAYRGLIAADMKQLTQTVMQTDVLPALEEWAAARTVSALKGDHRPSKEWLIAAQAIDPDTARASVAVGFQVVLAPSPGTPAYVNAQPSSVVAVQTPAPSVQAHPAAFTPASDDTTHHGTDEPTSNAEVVTTQRADVLSTQTPHGSAYIAPPPNGVRTPLDATPAIAVR
jgi:hypothetical protein